LRRPNRLRELASPITGHATAASTEAAQTGNPIAASMAQNYRVEIVAAG
jgi:hypothetical protein